MSDVPKSSIYRHLRTLLDGGLVSVTETRLVKGIQEKSYRLAQKPHLGPDDMAGLTADDHFRYFTTYFMTVLQGFSDYLAAAEADGGAIDMLADRTGYTEVGFFANSEELNTFQGTVNKAFMALMNNQAGEGRHKHKMALVTHPVRTLRK
jgi:hypothetical protein